jgi:hypothetical protein
MLDIPTTHPAEGPYSAGQRRAPDARELPERLAALGQLTYAGLQAEWRRLYRSHPPKKIGRDLLELAVAWKLQEKALGGLSAATKRQLESLAQTMRTKGDLAKHRTVKLKSGARLVREWHGETHDVLVLDRGFQWRGQKWPSLSSIAREITGTRWSGPRFFGLSSRTTRAEPIRTGTGAVSDLRETADA